MALSLFPLPCLQCLGTSNLLHVVLVSNLCFIWRKSLQCMSLPSKEIFAVWMLTYKHTYTKCHYHFRFMFHFLNTFACISLENVKNVFHFSSCSLLSFTVPHVEILDERGSTTPEKYYKAGSTIELQCVITKIPQPTSYITWRHNVRSLNYDTSRGGIRWVKHLYIFFAVSLEIICSSRDTLCHKNGG